jgi:DNA-binding YbaB/EbfC family protein
MAKQAQEIQNKIQKAEEEFALKDYSSTSGGGAVKAIVSGDLKVKEIVLNDEIVNKNEKEMLSDLIVAAVNEALRTAKTEKDAVIEKLSGGFDFEGRF